MTSDCIFFSEISSKANRSLNQEIAALCAAKRKQRHSQVSRDARENYQPDAHSVSTSGQGLARGDIHVI